MDNQHREIKGYRELDANEIYHMNLVKSEGGDLEELIEKVSSIPDVDKRWVAIGKTHLQEGLMALTRAIAKPTTFIFAFLLLTGCSGGKYYQSWPMESEVNGEVYHYHNAVQLNLPATMFHATNSENWVENCKTKLDDPQTEAQFLYPFQNCVREEKYQLTTMGSVASQFVTPVLSTTVLAGGIAYAGHAVGRGLGKSGTTVNQGGANAENTTNSGNKTVKGDTNINSGNKNIMK